MKSLTKFVHNHFASLLVMIFVLLFFSWCSVVFADTPPPNNIKARIFSGDGLTSIGASGDALKCNITNSSLPVTGSFYPAVQPVSAASPLPVTGSFYQAVQPISASSPIPVTGSFYPATQPVSGPLTNSELRASPVPISGAVTTNGLTDAQLRASPVTVELSGVLNPLDVNVLSSALPTGAATAFNQVQGNNSLSSIDTKLNSQATSTLQTSANSKLDSLVAKDYATQATLSALNSKVPVLGQALPANSSPVVLPASQIATLTPLTAVGRTWSLSSGSDSVTVSGTITANTGGLTDAQLRASPVPVSLTSTTITSSALPTGASTLAEQQSQTSLLSSIDGKLTAPLSVSGTVEVTNQITGYATAANQVTANASLSSIDSKLTSPLTVSVNNFPVTQQVSGTVNVGNFPSVQAVSQSGIWTTARSWFLSSVNDSVAAVQSGIWNITNITGTISLPTGASTAANQVTANNSLASIDSKLTSPITVKPTSETIATYSASVVNLVPALTPTDVFTITGSNTKIIKIRSISFSCTQTNNTVRDVLVIKRSTANTGGTSTASAAVPHDSLFAAATASVLSYTANPTLGTAVGTILADKIQYPATNEKVSFAQARPFELQYPIVLRSTSEVIAVNLNAVTSAGALCNGNVRWTEE